MKNDDYFSGILEWLSFATDQMLRDEPPPTNDAEFWAVTTKFLLQNIPHVSLPDLLSVVHDAISTDGQAIRLMLAVIAENDKLQKIQNETLARLNTKRREHGLELLKMPDWNAHAKDLLSKLREKGATAESTTPLKLVLFR